MPTGLTHKIYDGSDITLRGFALACATQLNAGYIASDQGSKDLPLYKAPIIPIDDYHLKQIHEYEKKLKYWKKVEENPEELDKVYEEYLQKRISENNKYSDDKSELKSRYTEMISKVVSWDLPKEYIPLKEIMLSQLQKSMDWDCSPYKPYMGDPLTKEMFIKDKIYFSEDRIKYHTQMYEKEIEHNKEINNYLKGLYNEIDKIEPHEYTK